MPEGSVSETLRAARERSGRSIASVARQLLASEAQLRSLEAGSLRGFYNARHRRTLERRYADALGVEAELVALQQALFQADPERRLAQGHSSPSPLDRSVARPGGGESSSQQVHRGSACTVDGPLLHANALQSPSKGGSGRRQRSFGARMDYWLAAGALGGLAVWFSIDAWRNYRKDPVADPLLAVQKRLDEAPVPLQLARQADIKGPRSASGAEFVGSAETLAGSAGAAEGHVEPQAPLPSAVPARPSGSLAQPFPRSKPGSGSGSVEDSDARVKAAGSRLEPRSEVALAAPAAKVGQALAGEASLAARSVDLCEVSDTHAATAVPVSRLKSTPYLHISSGVTQRLCVRTADGRQERLQLSANESRSVFGRAPFTVVSEQPASIDIFYLGARVRHSGESRVLKVVDPDPIS